MEGIEKGAAGGFGPEGAEETKTEVVGIGDTGTVAGQMARDGEAQQGLEEGVGERGGVQRRGHNNHNKATLTIIGARGNEGDRSWFPEWRGGSARKMRGTGRTGRGMPTEKSSLAEEPPPCVLSIHNQ